jgi:hypothetical protein
MLAFRCEADLLLMNWEKHLAWFPERLAIEYFSLAA